FHFQHIGRNRRFPFQHRTFRAGWRLRLRLRLRGLRLHRADRRKPTQHRQTDAENGGLHKLHHYSPPFFDTSAAAAAFGIVVTTVRFCAVRYCRATRCTSLTVTAAIASVSVLILLGSFQNTAFSASSDARPSDDVSRDSKPRRASLRAF